MEELRKDEIEEAAKNIKSGGIVIFPTETVYGIGANALDKNAVKRIFELKERNLSKPISVLVSDFEMIEKIAKDISDIEYKIMKAFFPGPLTIILKKNDLIPDIVTSGQDSIGIRMPEGEIAKELVKKVGIPLATTSANISGNRSGTNIKDIKKDFDGKVDYIIDGGESKIGIASTVIKVVDGKIVVLREGSISKEDIEKILVLKG